MLIRNNTNLKNEISVITATFNVEKCIHHLIESLRKQDDTDFEWVVIDGASTDKTLEILKNVKDLNIKIISEPDFGIYDAFNKGIRVCKGKYYLVAGADDILYPNAISDYKRGIDDRSEIITANFRVGGKIAKPMGYSWLFGMRAFISGHSVGALIKKDLHFQYNFYSNRFPIAADQLFIKQCCQRGVQVKLINTVVGEYGTHGVSATDIFGGCTELFRIQLITNENKWIQYFLLIIKLTLRLFR